MIPFISHLQEDTTNLALHCASCGKITTDALQVMCNTCVHCGFQGIHEFKPADTVKEDAPVNSGFGGPGLAKYDPILGKSKKANAKIFRRKRIKP